MDLPLFNLGIHPYLSAPFGWRLSPSGVWQWIPDIPSLFPLPLLYHGWCCHGIMSMATDPLGGGGQTQAEGRGLGGGGPNIWLM